MNNWKNKLLAGGVVLASGVSAHAQTTGVDYSALQSAVTGEIPGVLTAGLAIGAAAVGLLAAPKGVRFIKKMWSAIAG